MSSDSLAQRAAASLYEPLWAATGASSNLAEQRDNKDAARWEGGNQPPRRSPSVSTHYKYKLNLADRSPAMPLSVVTATRRNLRRREYANGGAHNRGVRRSEGEKVDEKVDADQDADQDAAERAQVSSVAQPSTNGVKRSATGTNSNCYRRPELDMPRAGW